MTAPLADYQFELDGVRFGLGLPVAVEPSGFDSGTAEWNTEEILSPRSGGRVFGPSIPQAPTWAWSAFVDRDNPEDALVTLAQLKKAWRAAYLRGQTGAVTMLRYALAGRTRVVFGQPNRFAAPIDNKLIGGSATITCDFKCADDLTYSDEEKSSGFIGMAPSSAAGLQAPLTAPLSLVGESVPREGSITVGGDEATWAVVKFYGPSAGSASGLRLVVDGGFEVLLAGPLGKDQTAVVDPRPWSASVLRNDGVSLAGQMASPMWLMKLAPGAHDLRFSAVDPTGTSRCEVSWREASPSL